MMSARELEIGIGEYVVKHATDPSEAINALHFCFRALVLTLNGDDNEDYVRLLRRLADAAEKSDATRH
jgi:hypothetical protein